MLVLGFVVVLWVVPIFVAGRLTMERGRGKLPGALLGGFLGWVGVVIAACLSTTGPSAFPSKSGPVTTCPYCAEQIQPAAKVCRWCGRDLPVS